MVRIWIYVDVPWLEAKPTPRLRRAVAMNFGGGEREKEEEEEVLVIEGIEFERELGVKFDVYINDEDDVAGGPSKAEFAGSFVNVAHKHKHKHKKMKTNLRLGISELLEDLDAEDDEHVLVTLVPKFGKGHVTVGGITIEFHK